MTNKLNRTVLLLLSFMTVSVSISSAADSVRSLLDDIARHNAQIKDISFTFVQDIFVAGSTRSVSADIYFKRPEKLKALYSQPYAQEIYFYDGHLYTYIPRIGQATRQKKSGFDDLFGISATLILSDSPYELLKDKKQIKLSVDENEEGMAVISSLSGNSRIDIYIDRKILLPVKTVAESENYRSVTVFKNYRENVKYEDKDFIFDKSRAENYIEID